MIACPSQIQTVDRDAILAMLVYYKGKFQTSLNASCTHLVTGKPAGRKYEYALKHQIKVFSLFRTTCFMCAMKKVSCMLSFFNFNIEWGSVNHAENRYPSVTKHKIRMCVQGGHSLRSPVK